MINQKSLYNPTLALSSVYIPFWLLQVPVNKLSFQAKVLYGILAEHCDDFGLVIMSSNQLSKSIGCEPRSIRRYIFELKEARLIGTYQNESGGINHFEFYKHPWMEEPLSKELDIYGKNFIK